MKIGYNMDRMGAMREYPDDYKTNTNYREDLAFMMGVEQKYDDSGAEKDLTTEEMFLVLCRKLDRIADIIRALADGKTGIKTKD